ncbi:MAG: PGF-pre-PGF domain-containing protein, partial [Candidatus Woesearchaeota archaeon]
YSASGLDYKTTKLLRWKNNAWETLDTKLVSTDGVNYVFEATLQGLSVFAVVAESVPGGNALQLLDMIREFYAGKSSYTALQLLDKIRAFYGGQ